MDTSITTHKLNFLNSQTRLLSAPLHHSPHATTEPLLTTSQLTSLLTQLNTKLKAHSRTTFTSQSNRHVAEQIDNLYWNEVNSSSTRQEGKDTTVVKRDADLLHTEIVNSLPESLREAQLEQEEADDTDETTPHFSHSESQQYHDLRLRLIQLAAQRDEKLQKLQRYQKLQVLLRPYEKPESNVQPNLVQKDGEMAEELARLRVLCARIAGRVDGWDRQKQKGDQENRSGEGFEEKLKRIMEAA